MIIDELSVTDFRVFKGKHDFALTPRKRWGAERPIVLFGGLNGAGKTSLLSAVRLVLYGKQTLGSTVSQRAYEDYLRSSIHRSRDRIVQAAGANLTLCFRYTHMGVTTKYRVVRTWAEEGTKLTESLKIFQDDKELNKLSDEQKQGFLNELIPLGLADLFFFDGEKISELAMDEGGAALSQSIKKLLGLDLVERLEKDLSVIIRDQQKQAASADLKQRLEDLQRQLEVAEKEADEAEQAFHAITPEWLEAQKHLERAESEFLAKGGGFAATRAQDIEKQRLLDSQRAKLREDTRILLSGSYPLALAPSVMKRTLLQLETEADLERDGILRHYREKLTSALADKLTPEALDTFNEVAEDLSAGMGVGVPQRPALHDVGPRVLGHFESTLEQADRDRLLAAEAKKELKKLGGEIEDLSIQIARAPDEGTLEDELQSLQDLKERVVSLGERREKLREEARFALRRAGDLARALDALHSELDDMSGASSQTDVARSARSALAVYSERAASAKTVELEKAFSESFQRLSRKDDLNLSARIDPASFKVTLVDDLGVELDKDEDLSKGERQIYAIAMLEALATTSGKRLPIIIDTPLGRLDSKHRKLLVDHYFSVASHQVVILSTDTEVDEQFYASLYKDMSHAYKLEYDGLSGSTNVVEGYFWRQAAASEVA